MSGGIPWARGINSQKRRRSGYPHRFQRRIDYLRVVHSMISQKRPDEIYALRRGECQRNLGAIGAYSPAQTLVKRKTRLTKMTIASHCDYQIQTSRPLGPIRLSVLPCNGDLDRCFLDEANNQEWDKKVYAANGHTARTLMLLALCNLFMLPPVNLELGLAERYR